MSIIKQEIAAEKFAKDWSGKGYEKGQSQSFWITLLRNVYGIEEPEKYISFEEQVHLDHTSFIDGHIPSTKVLIEQKSIDKKLDAPIRQSDGSFLTPFEQAKRYVLNLPLSEHPRWIVISNFAEFHIYDMEHPEKKDPEVVLLKNLGKEYSRMQFLVDDKNTAVGKEMEVSFQAGELVGKLYDSFLKEYKDRTNPESLKSLNKLCVRLVFCLYAEDVGVFPVRNQFFNYLNKYSAGEMRNAVLRLFAVLNQEESKLDPYLEKELADFPYVNGGLFADDTIEVPQFTDGIKDLLLRHASEDFDWSEISPTIFGALFESTLNQETRRSNGMHYTSIENIHKVIDPLFLDGLWDEFRRICDSYSNTDSRNKQLEVFHKKLSKLRFLIRRAVPGIS